MFHALCLCAANLLVGKTAASRSNPAWRQVYRAVEHRLTKDRCKNQKMGRFPEKIQDFATFFIRAQEARHDADYAARTTLKRSEVLVHIGSAEEAIRGMNACKEADIRAFCVFCLLRAESSRAFRAPEKGR